MAEIAEREERLSGPPPASVISDRTNRRETSQFWYENAPRLTVSSYDDDEQQPSSLLLSSSESDSSESDTDDSDNVSSRENSQSKTGLSTARPSFSVVKEGFKVKLSFQAAQAEKVKAANLYNTMVSSSTTSKSKHSGVSSNDKKWLQTMLKNGTLSDKVAAMTLLIQESPLRGLETFDGLITMANRQQSREAVLAIEAIKDLLVTNILPSRKLKRFHENDLGNRNVTDEHRIYWYFEDVMKERFNTFINIVENGLSGTLPYFKRACLNSIYRLLDEKPEGEGKLLRILINKLGDPDHQIASKVVYLLQQILGHHPMMKEPVVKAVEELLYRPNIATKSQYYAVIFLNQISLERSVDKNIATRMIRIYFSIFEMSVTRIGGGRGELKNKKGIKASKNEQAAAMRTKLLSGLLTGVNRAFPYAGATGPSFSKLTDTLFRIVHTSTFNTAIQALMLLLQVMTAQDAMSDRFYKALYAKLNSPDVETTSKHSMFLNIVYKAMKFDKDNDRVKAFALRLLQVALKMDAPFVAGVLYTLSEVMRVQPAVKDLICMPVQKVTPNKVIKDDQTKDSGDSKNSSASEPEVPSEKLQRSKKKGDGSTSIEGGKEDSDNGSTSYNSDDSSSSDSSGDSSSSDSSGNSSTSEKITAESFVKLPGTRLRRAPNGDTAGETIESGETIAADRYDPHKRDPKYASADKTCAWIMCALSNHYHPSVRKFTETLLNTGSFIEYAGDPLRDFGTTAFLERFSYRNPKQKDIKNIRGKGLYEASSVMQRTDARKYGHVSSANPVNTKNFLYQKSTREEEAFFMRFFREKEQRSEKKQAGKGAVEEDSLLLLEGDDEEDGFDKFSQELAEGLLKEKAGNESDGEDDEGTLWDFSDDEDVDGDEEVNLSKDNTVSGGGSSEDDDGRSPPPNERKRKFLGNDKQNPFADAEDFASLLEQSGKDYLHEKERAWANRAMVVADEKHSNRNGKKKRRKRT
jgi:ribosome biogenesis protein MAK21